MPRSLNRKQSFAALAAISVFLIAVPALAQPSNYADWADQGAQPGDLPQGAVVTPPAAPVLGGLTFYTDRALFDADAPGLPKEDFENGNVPAGGVTGCSDPFDSTTADACWAAGDVIPGFSLGSSSGTGTVILGAGLIGNTSIVSGPNAFADFTILGLTDPTTNAAGMDLVVPLAETFDIRIFGEGDVLLGTTTGDASPAGIFWGVISDVPIIRIEIESPSGAGDLIDNLCFGAVAGGGAEIPALDWLGMLLLFLGLSAAAVFVLRRK